MFSYKKTTVVGGSQVEKTKPQRTRKFPDVVYVQHGWDGDVNESLITKGSFRAFAVLHCDVRVGVYRFVREANVRSESVLTDWDSGENGHTDSVEVS